MPRLAPPRARDWRVLARKYIPGRVPGELSHNTWSNVATLVDILCLHLDVDTLSSASPCCHRHPTTVLTTAPMPSWAVQCPANLKSKLTAAAWFLCLRPVPVPLPPEAALPAAPARHGSPSLARTCWAEGFPDCTSHSRRIRPWLRRWNGSSSPSREGVTTPWNLTVPVRSTRSSGWMASRSTWMTSTAASWSLALPAPRCWVSGWGWRASWPVLRTAKSWRRRAFWLYWLAGRRTGNVEWCVSSVATTVRASWSTCPTTWRTLLAGWPVPCWGPTHAPTVEPTATPRTRSSTALWRRARASTSAASRQHARQLANGDHHCPRGHCMNSSSYAGDIATTAVPGPYLMHPRISKSWTRQDNWNLSVYPCMPQWIMPMVLW